MASQSPVWLSSFNDYAIRSGEQMGFDKRAHSTIVGPMQPMVVMIIGIVIIEEKREKKMIASRARPIANWSVAA